MKEEFQTWTLLLRQSYGSDVTPCMLLQTIVRRGIDALMGDCSTDQQCQWSLSCHVDDFVIVSRADENDMRRTRSSRSNVSGL
jgi:hypothetical protein